MNASQIVLRKIIISQIVLKLAQNLGIDYYVFMEELYYYMRKKDMETHTELMHTIKSITDKTMLELFQNLLLFWQKNVSK